MPYGFIYIWGCMYLCLTIKKYGAIITLIRWVLLHGLLLYPYCLNFSALSFKNKNKNTQQKTNQKIKLLPWGRGGVVCVIKKVINIQKRIFFLERVTVTLFYRMKIHHRTSEVPWMDAAWPAGPGASPWLSSSRPAAVIIPDGPGPQAEQSNHRSAPPKLVTRPASCQHMPTFLP